VLKLNNQIMQMNIKTTVLDNTAEKNENFIDNKWGNQLIDYRNYVKVNIKHYRKAQKGNEVSIATYPYMKVKWEALNDRLTAATKKKSSHRKTI
jgi:hypothetical protein